MQSSENRSGLAIYKPADGFLVVICVLINRMSMKALLLSMLLSTLMTVFVSGVLIMRSRDDSVWGLRGLAGTLDAVAAELVKMTKEELPLMIQVLCLNWVGSQLLQMFLTGQQGWPLNWKWQLKAVVQCIGLLR